MPKAPSPNPSLKGEGDKSYRYHAFGLHRNAAAGYTAKMETDIVIFAVIAVLILAKLWQVLGRKNDGDPERPNPFATPPSTPAPDIKPAVIVRNPGDVPVLPPIFTLAPTSLAGGLAQVKMLDAGFDERQFLRDRRADFVQIVGDFAKGDLSTCEKLMTPDVLKHFTAAVAQRVGAGQTLENKITRMVDNEVAAVKIDGGLVTLTVRFVSDQQNVLRDAAGAAIGGAEGKVEEITDLWSFRRDMSAAGSVWQLAETKS